MRKALLVLSLVGLTMVASAGNANAQRRGYGGYWGNAPVYSMGWGSSGYYPQSGYYSSYYGGMGYSPYYQTYGYNYSPYYYNTVPSYAVTPGSYYSQPAVRMQATRVVQSFYSEPERAQQFATVTVVVPTANAQVWFGDTLTTQQGTERLFHSPALEPGNFTYTIRARWMENGTAVERDRQVNVRAGQRVTVNFRDSPSETAPPSAPAPRN